MTNGPMDRTLKTVRDKHKNRRVSVLTDDAAYIENNLVEDPWQIASVDHLRAWTAKNSDRVMEMIKDLRFERDQFLAVAVQFDEGQKELEKAKTTVVSYQKRIDDLKEELKNVATDKEDNALDPHSEDRKPPIPSAQLRYSKSIPDPPLFTDGNDPTWEDWSSKVEQKLTVNYDHYPTQESKMAFVIGRLGGLAVTHTTTRRKRNCLNPYTSYEEILDQLAEVFEDTNELGMAKIHYDKLVMGTMTFRAFFAEFMRLGEILSKRDESLLDDLPKKLPDTLALALRRRGLGPRASLREVKAYLLTQDDGDRAYYEEKALERSLRTKSATRSSVSTPKSSSYPAKRTAPLSKADPTPAVKTEVVSKEYSCFLCGKEGHRKPDCPDNPKNQKKPSTPAKVNAVDTEDSNSEVDEEDSSSDSGNE